MLQKKLNAESEYLFKEERRNLHAEATGNCENPGERFSDVKFLNLFPHTLGFFAGILFLSIISCCIFIS